MCVGNQYSYYLFTNFLTLNTFKLIFSTFLHSFQVYDFDAASAFHDVSSARSSFALHAGTAPTGPPATPKPLLSRANTKTGEPIYGSSGSPMVETIDNPMTARPVQSSI